MRRTQMGIVALGAFALAATLAALRVPGPVELGASLLPVALGFAILLFALEQQGFVFHWRGQSTKLSLDEVGIFVGVLLLPPALVVLAVTVATLANQLVHRREALKTAFNVAQYTVAAVAAVAVSFALHAAGLRAPWSAALAPVVFSGLTALQVSLLFARLERVSTLRVFTQRFGAFVAVAGTLGASLGLVVYALWSVHPAAVLAAVPVFAYLRRFGRLSEWADDELTTHRLVASVSAEVAGRADLDAVSESILGTCHELFQCGQASLTLAQEPGAQPRVWERRFGESAGYGGVSAEILGAGGARLGSLSVFPKPAQRRYGEREHQLLRTVAASATAAAANAQALRAAREANRELSESEERYRSLFDTAHVLIHVLDADGHIVDANPAAGAALGWSREELQHRTFTDLLSPSCELLERLREEGEIVGLECELRGADGLERAVLLDARALAGEEARYVVFARDITPLKVLESELRRSMATQHETIKRLENMNRELEEFTLWTTHDMREPLRSIGTIADFLHEDLGTVGVDEARDMARRIREGAERLKERVKALHAFSLIVQRDDEFQDVDMQAVVASVLASLETKIAERGALIVLPRDPLPVVRAQPHRIDQVFANLIENALKYGRAAAPPGASGVRPTVEIGVAELDGGWRFHVRDNGSGIPAGYHDRIFQLFQRGPDPGESGSGAGLAIVKRIAEQHGGRAWVESREGQGATFYVTIPRPVSPEVPLVAVAAARKPF
ncbi:MAG TPA: ATP-binding protein [Candidatus Thermoplasmatota archaeon]|nr:ATP-binding protein [Candidatus Thermoplasmatota archaeon]